MKSYDIIQVPHSYSFALGFYGVCDGNVDSECIDYDLKLSVFRRIVDSVYEVSSEQSNTTFSWYKSDLYATNLNHFDKRMQKQSQRGRNNNYFGYSSKLNLDLKKNINSIFKILFLSLVLCAKPKPKPSAARLYVLLAE